MQEYNAMPSNRRRVICSSAPLGLERSSDAEYEKLYKSPLQVTREHCVESGQPDITQVDSLIFMNAFNHIKQGDKPTFTITSTPIRAGSTGANMVPLETDLCLKFMHIPVDKFNFGDLSAFTADIKQGAQCIPVSFADKMLRSVLNEFGQSEDWSNFLRGVDPLVYTVVCTTDLWPTPRWCTFRAFGDLGASQSRTKELLCSAWPMTCRYTGLIAQI